MKIEARKTVETYDRFTIEVFEFYFGDEGGLKTINQSVYIDADGDGVAQTTIVSEREIELVDVPASVVENVHARLGSAKQDLYP